MAIPRFTPSDLGGQQFTHDPGSVATAIESSFYRAQENVRQNDESARADERLAIQQQDQAMRQEETAYQKTLRPLREQSMQLGVASQGLQIASQSVGLQSAQLGLQGDQIRLGQQQQNMNFLTESLQRMGQGQQSQTSTVGLIDQVKPLEGFSSSPYDDNGQTSIGYGTVARPGEVSIDEATATARLQEELGMHAGRVDKAASKFGVSLSPSQRDALTSFDFNTGSAERVLERAGGDLTKVPGIMQEWRKSGGKVLPGLVNRRQAEAAWFQSGGTGVPSLSQVVSAKTPTGVPVIAAAANSLSPQAVITQAFTPEQQRNLNDYDRALAIAKTGNGGEQTLAAQMVQVSENNPAFAATLAQRQELIKSTQAQVQVQGMLQSAPNDLVKGFEARYGDKFRIASIDGNQVPVNAQGQPLNSQGYAAFSQAFTEFKGSHQWDPQAAMAPYRDYEEAIPLLGRIAAFQRQGPPILMSFLAPGGGEPLTPQDGKVYEDNMKAYNEALVNYNKEAQGVRQSVAELSLRAGRNPLIRDALMTMFPAPQAAPATAEAPPPSPPKPRSIKDLADGGLKARVQAEDEQVVGGLVQDLDKRLSIDYPDNGRDSTDNPALVFAARIHEGDTDAIREAIRLSGWDVAEELTVTGKGTGLFNERIMMPADVVKEAAKQKLIKAKYLDPKTGKPVKAGATAAGSRPNISSVTQEK